MPTTPSTLIQNLPASLSLLAKRIPTDSNPLSVREQRQLWDAVQELQTNYLLLVQALQ